MFAANTYLIRLASDADATSLSHLAELDSHVPLTGRVLIGEVDGVPAAAMSLDDGRIIADPHRCPSHLLASLRVKAGALRAYEATPSLRIRMLAVLPAAEDFGSAHHSGPGAVREPDDRAKRPGTANRRTRRGQVRTGLVAVSD